jgi:hypothetical protein
MELQGITPDAHEGSSNICPNAAVATTPCGKRCGKRLFHVGRKRPIDTDSCRLANQFTGCEEVRKALIEQGPEARSGVVDKCRKSASRAQEAGVTGPIREAQLSRFRAGTEKSCCDR